MPLLAAALATTWQGPFWSVGHFAMLTGGLGVMDMQPWLVAPELFTQIGTYHYWIALIAAIYSRFRRGNPA